MSDIQKYINSINSLACSEDVKQTLYDSLDKINKEIESLFSTFNKINLNEDTMNKTKDDFSSTLKSISSLTQSNTVNILSYKDNTDYWDVALKAALATNKMIYFPSGIYHFKEKEYNLNPGNIIYGDGTYETILIYCGNEDLNNNTYFFKMINKTGFKNLQITFENDFAGKAILLEPNNTNDHRRFFTLENTFVNFNFASGYGTGLSIIIKNYDALGNVFSDDRGCGFVYFHPNNLEIAYGEKGIEILLSQKGNVINPCWITENIYTNCNLNSCLYGLYFSTENTSSKPLADFNVKFNKLSIQIKEAGFFRSSPNMGIAMYLAGEDETEIIKNPLTMQVTGVTISIWDSSNGYNGVIKNCNLKLSDVYMSRYISDSETYYGFKHIGSKNLISVNGDTSYSNRTCFSTGKALEVTNIDAGNMYRYDTDVNGWNCKTEVTYKREGTEQVYKVQNTNNLGVCHNVLYSLPNNLNSRKYNEDLTTFLANDVTLVYHVFDINIIEGIKIYEIDLSKFNIENSNPIVVGINRISNIGDDVSVIILSTCVNNKILYLKLEKNSTINIVATYGVTLLCYKSY